jgi:hypothetical protein
VTVPPLRIKSMKPRLVAIQEMRELSERFIRGKLPFDQFKAMLGNQMGAFDPLDWGIQGLPKELETEVLFYSRWLGGEFGEDATSFPRLPDWEYGKSKEPYGWIDKEQYRRLFAAEFEALKLRPLSD